MKRTDGIKIIILFTLLGALCTAIFNSLPPSDHTSSFAQYMEAVDKSETMEDPFERCVSIPVSAGSKWSKATIAAFCHDAFFPYKSLQQLSELLEMDGGAGVDRYYEDLVAGYYDGRYPEGGVRHSFYGPFSTSSSRAEAFISSWLDSSPSSAYAFTARGIYQLRKAGDARGGKSFSETPEEDIRKMKVEIDAALSDLILALQANPKIWPGYLPMIDAYRYLGQRHLAKLVFDQSLAVAPTNFYLRAAYSDLLQPRWGGSLSELDAFAAASAKLEEQNPRLRNLSGIAIGHKGFSDYRKGKYNEAFHFLEQSVAEAPTFFYMELAGYSANQLQRFDKAYEIYTQVLRFTPTNAIARQHRSRALKKMREFKRSLADMEVAVRVKPDDAGIQRDYALILIENRDLAGAEAALLRAIELNPEDEWTQRRLAELYLETLNKPQSARPIIDNLLKRNPCNAFAWLLEAEHAEHQGGTGKREALKQFLQCANDKDPAQQDFIRNAKVWLDQNP